MFEVEWTSTHYANFDLDEIVEIARSFKTTDPEKAIRRAIEDVVAGLDDADYYSWNEEAEAKLEDAIKERIGGVQISMFD